MPRTRPATATAMQLVHDPAVEGDHDPVGIVLVGHLVAGDHAHPRPGLWGAGFAAIRDPATIPDRIKLLRFLGAWHKLELQRVTAVVAEELKLRFRSGHLSSCSTLPCSRAPALMSFHPSSKLSP